MRAPRLEITNPVGISSSGSAPLSIRNAILQRQQSGTSGRSTRSSRRNSRNQQNQRFHFNHLEGGMPVNIWGIDRRDVWKTCFCFHVRTVTIFIGVCHLMFYILFLSFLAAVFMYDTSDIRHSKSNPMLPTPVSVSNNNEKQYMEGQQEHLPKSDSLTVDQSENPRGRLDPLSIFIDPRQATSQVVLLNVCNMLITLLMVYGAVRGKPSYLMPFFVLRVFDFCIFCLTMVGYFSYLPNVTDSISQAHWIDWIINRDALLDMDPQLLSLLALLTIVILIAVKAYIIGVVWNCYKYLMLRNSVIRTVIAYRHDDPTNLVGMQQNLLPDLPDYDTAVNDPRYAKKPPVDANDSNATLNRNPSSVGVSAVVPPPPYNVAVAAEPLTFNFVVPVAERTPERSSSEAINSVITNENTTTETFPVGSPEPIPVTVHGENPTHGTIQFIAVAPARDTDQQ